ncbi:hypothetical protein CISG_05291 [Coccidioides immitis RMSCC 3703]|uniref:Uncharacterized protein n=1 Tax=Coccidioides immitis RMSCC 3703 TaxID=454286 RepID=A0A0J8QU91_COCIT|nr:hypothetical protein CISG_05291 [Coccidioides immitis RMSCC 3703]
MFSIGLRAPGTKFDPRANRGTDHGTEYPVLRIIYTLGFGELGSISDYLSYNAFAGYKQSGVTEDRVRGRLRSNSSVPQSSVGVVNAQASMSSLHLGRISPFKCTT